MTVKELKNRLERVIDDTLIVLVEGGPDHSYIRLTGTELTCVGQWDNDFLEWYGEDHAGPDERPRHALVLKVG